MDEHAATYRGQMLITWPTALGALFIASFICVAPSAKASEGATSEAVHTGSGGILLPRSIPVADRHLAAECEDCTWQMTTVCVEEVAGSRPSAAEPCRSVSRGCPQDQHALRIWLLQPAAAWRDVGVACIDRPRPMSEIGVLVARTVEQGLPQMKVGVQPRQGIVAQLPVQVRSGQAPGYLDFTHSVEGFPMQGVARARWSWDFADGNVVDTVNPGCRYPCTGLTHVYRQAGAYQIQVEARWTVEYVIDGLGPFRLPRHLVQEARIPVAVGEGRALLSASR